MKRLLTIFAIVAVLCAFCSVTAMAADDTIEVIPSDSTTGVAHTVNPNPIEVKDATCTEAGYIRYQCLEEECAAQNLFHDVIIPATGHQWSTDEETTAYGPVAELPTCQTTGSAYVYCTVCGETNGETRELATIAHDYSVKVVDEEATCLEGKYHYECSMCGEAETDEKGNVIYYSIEALTGDDAHSYTDWNIKTAATCCAEGLEYRVCTRCSAAQYRTTEKLEHSYVITDKYLASDCETIYVTFTCTHCAANRDCACDDATYTETIEGDFHKWVLKDTTATCTEAGTATYVCAYNEEHTKTEEVDALGHEWGEWVLSETFTKDGVEYGLYIRQCERCEAANQQQVLPLSAGEPEDDDTDETEANTYAISTSTITKGTDTVSGTGTIIVVGDEEVGKLYARVAVVYENEAGEQILIVNMAEVNSDDMTFQVPYAKAPYGYTVKTVCIVAVTDGTAVDGAWADSAVSDPAIL